jgi:hypothetical protein
VTLAEKLTSNSSNGGNGFSVKQQLRRIALSGIQYLNTPEHSGDVESRIFIGLYYNK